jgi:hypothetical protein
MMFLAFNVFRNHLEVTPTEITAINRSRLAQSLIEGRTMRYNIAVVTI